MKSSTPHGNWILAATILGSAMAFIDGTVVNVALPVLQRDLDADVSMAQWVVESYALFLASLILVGGALGDRLGRRRVFTFGIVSFALASAWCGLSPTALQLVIARGFQGAGGAFLVPGSLAILSASFDDSSRGKAIGIWSAATAVTAAIGPVLGGWLVENLSWRWVFYINVPIALIALAITFWRVPESRSEEGARAPIDLAGAFLATLGLGALVFGLLESSGRGLADPLVAGAMLTGIASLIAFFVVETRIAHPMVPLGLFRSPVFAGTNAMTLLLYAALGALFFYFPFNLIQVQGYTPTQAGGAMLPFILLLTLLSGWAGGLVDHYGARLPLIVGPAITGVGFALFSVPGIGGTYWTTFFPAMLVMGFGMSLTVAPLTTAVMGSVGREQSGTASGINNAVSRVGSLLAIAVLGLVVLASFGRALDQRLDALDLPVSARAELEGQKARLGAAEVPADLAPEVQATVKRAIAESYVSSFRVLAWLSAALALASALSAAILLPKKTPDGA